MMNAGLAHVMTTPDNVRFDAVLARDRRFDREFVYAVTSTRIYCRPSCPSRRPRPDRVRFFDTAREAESAGYRACRRCHPDTADPHAQRIADVCAYIRAHADQRLTLGALSARAGLSPQHFQRAFTRIVGLSPREYAEGCRMRRLRQDLKNGRTVTRAMHDAGYGSSSRLYERAAPSLGMTPATYRKGGAGATIRYAISDSSFGRVLVAATEHGVAAVKIAASDRILERALNEEFHAAVVTRDDEGLRTMVRAVIDRVEPSHKDVPLDVAATAFQWRVWRALQKIPAGATRTYQEIARAIGKPSAARAVARACATNPVALVIPCHRVVPAAGGTGGYRWGPEIKEAILEQERARISPRFRSRRTKRIAAAGNDEPREGRAARGGWAPRAG